MSPTAKDLETSNSQTTARTPGAEEANKPQPVPLEVPVTVNGARTVEGSDKREPFSEATQTVLVFHNGAVIRLNSSVTAGQLLFLTNDKTKKEVVCQVVKSKNYRNVSGYVELEFTEPMTDFWGIHFPEEQSSSSSATVNPPAAEKPSGVSSLPSQTTTPKNAPVESSVAKGGSTNQIQEKPAVAVAQKIIGTPV